MPDISTTPDDKFELDMEDALIVHLNGFASGREYERKQIVAWLRAHGSDMQKGGNEYQSMAKIWELIAEPIERLDHLKPIEPYHIP